MQAILKSANLGRAHRERVLAPHGLTPEMADAVLRAPAPTAPQVHIHIDANRIHAEQAAAAHAQRKERERAEDIERFVMTGQAPRDRSEDAVAKAILAAGVKRRGQAPDPAIPHDIPGNALDPTSTAAMVVQAGRRRRGEAS